MDVEVELTGVYFGGVFGWDNAGIFKGLEEVNGGVVFKREGRRDFGWCTAEVETELDVGLEALGCWGEQHNQSLELQDQVEVKVAG